MNLVKFLPWDSRFFGLKIARLTTDTLTQKTASEALKQSVREKIDCLYFLARSDDASTLVQADHFGFHLVDIRLSFQRLLKTEENLKNVAPSRPPVRLRRASSKDSPALNRLAQSSYPHSRFAIDPHFPRGRQEKMFQRWATQSINGNFDDCVWVAEKGTTFAGFITCRQTHRHHGRIGLVGVAPRFRGKSIGTSLMGQAFQWFQNKGIETVTVVTQGSNIAAQRLYQNCGFRSLSVELWYHRWFNGKDAR
jgi:dTDP-4-amino-4,6-dideoxy-D-galactose acyltransferase